MSRSKENWYFLGLMAVFALLFGRPSSVINKPIIDIVVDISGFVIILLGLHIRIVSRDWKFNHGGERLVTNGPYGIVRNPMYLGSLLIGSGLCVIFGSLPFILFYIAVFLISHQLVVQREERHLRLRYVDDYENYTKITPAWFPSIAGLGRFLACSFRWTQSMPRALLREKNAIGGNLVGACLLEATADSMSMGWTASCSEVVVWLAVALFLSLLWVVGNKILLRIADTSTR